VFSLLLAMMLSAGLATAQAPEAPPRQTIRLEPGAPRPPARAADLAWLAGSWEGEGLGGRLDEVWSAPAGGAMVGYFRLMKDDKPVFYEIMTLLEVEGSVEMRLKHVNPDMTGWEEKNGFVTFKLVKHDASGAYFEGLTFRKNGPDAIEAFLALRNRADGTVREERLTYRRVK
jgi:hypothetical protein